EYYNHHVLNFLRAEHERANTGLVHLLKNGKRTVFKKDLREKYPLSKDFLYHITRENPDLLNSYKLYKSNTGAMGDRDLNPEFVESAFCDALIQDLGLIPDGSEGATRYHRYMIGALEFIFYPNLIIPKKEAEIDQGRKRIDIAYTNAAQSGFFFRAHTAYDIASNLVMVECKN